MNRRGFTQRHGIKFQDPGGRSALRAESKTNRRIYSCPDCGRKNVLTPEDVRLGYHCNACADNMEDGQFNFYDRYPDDYYDEER